MSRITRITGSFAIVVIAYWAYALVAVPWIEPAAALHRGKAITAAERDKAGNLIDPRLESLKTLFDPGVLNPQKINILESGRAKLLFERYRNFPDGRMKIEPCTIVFAYDGTAENEAQRLRQSIILEAPEGALLQFDRPLDLKSMNSGRLVGGRLDGKVVIRSKWKDPGPGDDLEIVTHDVKLTEQTISTVEPVDFRWGPNFGRGRDMVITLLAGQSPAEGLSAPNIAGVKSFELRHVERLHLDLGQAMAAPGAKPRSVPVEVHCRGPFRFDAVNHVATFHDNVNVMVKEDPANPSDQIACELLSLYFTDRMVAQRLVAQGNPAVVTAPSQKDKGGVVVSRAERFQYDLPTKSITLENLNNGREVFLQQGPNEIHARNLYYQGADAGRLGRLAAQGPGWFRGQAPDRPDQQLEASWNDQLRMEPDGQKQRISLGGGAELKFPGIGQLQAGEIFFWLLEAPPAAKDAASRPRPHSMMARHKVRMNSAQLAGRVEQLEVWFEEKGEGGGGKGEQASSDGRNDSLAMLPSTSPEKRPGTAVPEVSRIERPGTAVPGIGRVEVVGRLLRARVLHDGQQAAIANLTIEDGVNFQEIQTAEPGQRPLRIRGDRLTASDLSGPGAVVTVVGQPARFEGRGLGLTGANINLDRGANRVWIDGPGQMDVPLSGNGQGQASAPSGVATIDWRRSMNFDGREARFEENVVAIARQLQFEGKTMDVQIDTQTMLAQLQRPIRFSQPDAQGPTQIEEIQCLGGVLLENRSFDQQQQLASHDRMEVTDLAINVLSGEMRGGPGSLSSVFRGSPDVLSNAAAGSPGGRPAIAAPREQLNCLNVRFQKSISGNVWRRQVTFRDQVRIAYAPVAHWDAVLTTDNPDKLDPNGNGVVARCDELSVYQMGGARSIGLVGSGNAKVEGTTFTALGDRISYDQAKDWLILKGNGRSDAELFQQSQSGAPRDQTAAQEMHYWPKTNQLKVIGLQSLQMGQPSNGIKTR